MSKTSFVKADKTDTKCVIFVNDLFCARTCLHKLPAVIVGEYPFISAYGANIRTDSVELIASLPCVKAVINHSTVKTCLDKSVPKLGIPYPEISGLSGEGVTIAIIDTGINPHLDFMMPSNRIKFVDFIGGEVNAYDDNGHGTAVAGIACGNGLISGGLYKGVAPRANIISLKAISDKGEGGAFAILEAMQWIYENRLTYNIKVVCMSFGSNPAGEVDPLSVGAEALMRSGITVVASAGNEGKENGTIKSPGINPNIITVGAAKFEGSNIVVPDFSSRGSLEGFIKPDLVAPGVDITTCGTEDFYSVYSGTSMSAPMVAGLCALILSKKPNYTPDKVKELLMQNCIKLNYPPQTAGKGFINGKFLSEL